MTEEESKILFIVGDQMMPPGRIYGVFETEEQAKAAIKENDPADSMHYYIEEVELNQWIQYGWDV